MKLSKSQKVIQDNISTLLVSYLFNDDYFQCVLKVNDMLYIAT